MKNYLVLTAGSADRLADKVNPYLVAGWALVGGVAVASGGLSGEMTYAQAIAKPTGKDE